MKKKLFLILVISVFLLVAVALGLCLLKNKGDKRNEEMRIGIDGINLYYEMSYEEMIFVIGEPNGGSEYDEYNNKKYYFYNDYTAFGNSGSSMMLCFKSDKLKEVLIIMNVGEDRAETVFNEVSEYVSKLYSKKVGFYESVISEYDGLFFKSIVSSSDTYDQSVEIDREKGEVRFNANMSYKY